MAASNHERWFWRIHDGLMWVNFGCAGGHAASWLWVERSGQQAALAAVSCLMGALMCAQRRYR